MTRGRNDATEEEPGTAEGGWGRDIATATALLTIFPPAAAEAGDAARARRAFPIVGFALGLVAAAAWALGDRLGFYALGSSALAVAVVAALGGLRAEVGCAGFVARLGATDAEAARLRGVAAMVLTVLLRVGILAALSFAGTAAAVVAAAVSGSRIAMALAAGWLGRPEDDPLSGGAGRDMLWIVALVGLLILILFLGLWGALVAAALAAVAAAVVAALARRAGGLDRPALWAVQQATEIAILAGAVATL